jgi:hypothetical protein
MRRQSALVLLLAPLLTAPAFAGIFFNNKKSDPPNPAERVPELIRTIQTDGDEDKRMAAAAALRDYDAGQFTEVVPALIDALLNDKKPSVRAEAAQSLGKIRPVSDAVGQALDQSLAQDGSMRVRLQDRSALLSYRWSGWKEPAPKKDDIPTARPKTPPPIQSKEPPLAPNIPPGPPRLNLQPEPMPPLSPGGPVLVPTKGQTSGPELKPPPG